MKAQHPVLLADDPVSAKTALTADEIDLYFSVLALVDSLTSLQFQVKVALAHANTALQ
jgi:hypothetical protein